MATDRPVDQYLASFDTPVPAATIPAVMDGSDFSVVGRVALITGAARGIGMGMAQALAAAGALVAVQDIDLPVAEELVTRIRRDGGRAIALGGDVSDPTLAAQLVSQTLHQLGGLHILINNAAIQNPMPWLDVTAAEMEWQYRANMITPLLLCQQVAPIFRAQRWGRIINMGSIQQLRGAPHMVAYAVTKGALRNMTTTLARELAPDGITINVIAPGYFNTYRNRGDWDTEDMATKGKRVVPLGRVGEPSDCAGTTLLLCSAAGAYITGQTIHIDGGMSV